MKSGRCRVVESILMLVLIAGSAQVHSQTRTEAGSEIRRPETKDGGKPTFSSPISGPTLGWVFDQVSAGLRPILGIPGASLFGDVLELEIKLSRAWISSEKDYALVESIHDGEILLLNLVDGPIAAEPIPGVMPGASQIALSPTGASAIVYNRITNKIQFLTGLPSSPSVVREVDTSTLLDTLTAVAVSDDASAGLVAVSEGEKGSIYVVALQAEIQALFDLGQVSDISFLRNSHDALVADSGRNEIFFIRDVTEAATKLALAGEQEGLSHPLAVKISDDSRQVFISNRGSATISVLDLESGVMTHIPYQGVSSGFHRMRGNSVFRLNELSGSPLLLLDAGTEQPRILFVPPPNSIGVVSRGLGR